MPDDPAFVRMIAAAPDDDAPRLIYADYLDETGDVVNAARAEFIRVQVEKARLVSDTPRSNELWHREAAFLMEWARRWRADLPAIDEVQYGGFRRGFIDHVQASTAALYRHFQLIVDSIPLRAVTLGPVDVRSFRKIARIAEFTQIEDLRFAPGSRLSPALTRALIKASSWPRLRRLRLPDFTSDGALVLLGAAPRDLIALTEAFGDRLVF